MADSMLISRKYEVESLLGKGGMGEVYKVRHVTLGVISALKVLPSNLMDNPDLLKRFYREARVMAKLVHPNIVRVVDIDHDAELNFHYFVMEYIQGQTLRDYLQEKKSLSLEETLKLGRQVAQALQFAHGNVPPVIHRDIKPANIMIESKTHRIVLMDFGIAKELNDADMTRCEMMLGTIRYCPREQMLYKPLDGRADIYALGMVMYEAYTGDHLLAGLNENQVISRVLSDEENAPDFNSDTPAEFKALISKAIANSLDKRYNSMTEFLSDLEACWSLHIEKTGSRIIPENNTDKITDLDEYIQMLEQEKKRRLVIANKTKCQEEKEKAIQEEAEQSVKELYLEGCRQEVTANDYLNQSDFTLAQETFEIAANVFSEAYKKAFLIKRQGQAEQIKQQIQAIKSEADNFNAKEKACTFYGRALNLQLQAEELMETAAYDEAYQNYNQAYQNYADARELAAHKSQKEAAEIIQFQVRELAGVAKAIDADKFSPTYFSGAVESEKQADAAFTDEDFVPAKELYNIAVLRYSMAIEEALEPIKKQVQAARQQADESQKLAKQAGVDVEQEVYQQALLSYREGEQYFAQEDYKQALLSFEAARTGYQQAQRGADDERKYQNMLVAKGLAEQEQRKAEQAGAANHINDAFTKSVQLLEQAQHCTSLKNFEKAIEFYNKAADSFARFSSETQLEIARQDLDQSRQRLLTIQKQVKPLRTYAEMAWEEAEKLKAQAEKAGSAKEYKQAIEIYEAAYDAYERSKLEAERQLDTIRRDKDEKTVINTRVAKKSNRPMPGFAGINRRVIGVLLILLSVFGIYKLFDFAPFKRMIFEPVSSRSELTISKVTPESMDLSLMDGHGQAFSVDVPDKQKFELDYTWFLDGIEQAKGEKWFYTPVFNNAETAAKEIKVLITDHDGQLLEKIWKIKVVPKPIEGEVKAINHPPSIVAAEPFEQNIALRKGESKVFSVQATDSDPNDQLTYLWTLDGQTVSKGLGWFYQAEKEGKHTLILSVADKAGLQDRLTWDITTNVAGKNHAPRIINTIPSAQKLELPLGEDVNFSVDATDSDPDDQLTYSWSVDGHKESTSSAWLYKAQAEGQHKINLKVADSGGMLAQRKWLVITKASPAKCITLDENNDLCLPNSNVAGKKELQEQPASANTAITPDENLDSRPRIVSTNPSKQEIELHLGSDVNFSAEVADIDDNDQLTYKWSLDGKKKSTSNSWSYKAQTEGQHKVTLNVADKKGILAQRTWLVNTDASPAKCVTLDENNELCMPDLNATDTEDLPDQQSSGISAKSSNKNHAPRIVNINPSEQKLELLLGADVNFSVEAADDDPDDQLTYSWFLDRQIVSNSNTWFYKAQTEGRHKVYLRIADRRGRLAHYTWSVNTRVPSANCIAVDENSELCMPVQ